MLIIYDKTTPENPIKIVYSGYNMSIDTFLQMTPEAVGKYDGYLLSDDVNVIGRPRDYRFKNGQCILKPLCQFSLSKPQIISDGIDTSTLILDIIDTEEQFATIDILFNDTPYTVTLTNNHLELPITSETPGQITIKADPLKFRFTPVTLGVV